MVDNGLIIKISKIWEAFEIPKQISAPTYDNEGADALFRGTKFNSHTDEMINCHLSAFTFLTDEAFRYYFASLLFTALRSDGDASETLINHLQAPKGDVTRQSYAQRVGKFSSAQLQCILESLEALAEQGKTFNDELAIRSVKQLLSMKAI